MYFTLSKFWLSNVFWLFGLLNVFRLLWFWISRLLNVFYPFKILIIKCFLAFWHVIWNVVNHFWLSNVFIFLSILCVLLVWLSNVFWRSDYEMFWDFLIMKCFGIFWFWNVFWLLTGWEAILSRDPSISPLSLYSSDSPLQKWIYHSELRYLVALDCTTVNNYLCRW